jgi:hypothetical protein
MILGCFSWLPPFPVDGDPRKRFPKTGYIPLFGVSRMLYFHYRLTTRPIGVLQRDVGGEMKEILYKKRIDISKRIKTFSIHSQTEDEQCKTRVSKGFAYTVDWAREERLISRPPLVFIRKACDTKKGIETFSFHVKGAFYINHNREFMRVRFYHTLDIEIKWKIKNFSPKKSVSLT